MADYSPLFTFVVEHGYYDDGLAHGLSFVPTNSTAHIIKNTGLLVKPITGGICVLLNKKDRESLQLYAADKDEPFVLVFKVYAARSDFKSRTDVSVESEDSIPCFYNGNRDDADGGRVRLHDQDYVSMIDLIRLDSNQLEGVLDHRERRLPPLLIANIQINEEALVAVDDDADMAPKQYYVRLRERQVFWKYYLVGRMARENLFLVDVDSRAEFVCSGRELLDGQRETIAFRTIQRLSLKESPQYRFQLKEKDNGSEKVIIKRLPVADETHFGREVIDGRSEVVSEIYINC